MSWTKRIIAAVFVLALVGFVVIQLGVRIPMRPFFLVTSILIFYLGFKFIGTASLSGNQARPPDGDTRLMRCGSQHIEVLLRERIGATTFHKQYTDNLVIDPQRHIYFRASL